MRPFLSPIARASLGRKIKEIEEHGPEAYKGTAHKRTVRRQPAIADIIERADSLAKLKFARQAIEQEAFSGASPETKERWRKRLDERVIEFIGRAPTADDVAFIINTTLTTHEWRTAPQVKDIWRRAAAGRILELESKMNTTRNDSERADFVRKINEAEIVLDGEEINFINKVRDLSEFTPQQREGIDFLIEKHGHAVN